MHRGYISLWRRLKESDLWLSEPFTRGQAWVDLLMLANHKGKFFRVRGVKVDVPRGFVGYSQPRLAERWRWSRGKVRRFLNELETVQQIVQQKNNVTTLIKIVNYDQYQEGGTASGTASDTTNGQQTDPNNNVNNVNKKKPAKKLQYPDWLDRVAWDDYKQHRIALKSKMTPRAEELAIGALSKLRDGGYDPSAVILQSIDKGWKGLFEIKEIPYGSNRHANQEPKSAAYREYTG